MPSSHDRALRLPYPPVWVRVLSERNAPDRLGRGARGVSDSASPAGTRPRLCPRRRDALRESALEPVRSAHALHLCADVRPGWWRHSQPRPAISSSARRHSASKPASTARTNSSSSRRRPPPTCPRHRRAAAQAAAQAKAAAARRPRRPQGEEGRGPRPARRTPPTTSRGRPTRTPYVRSDPDVLQRPTRATARSAARCCSTPASASTRCRAWTRCGRTRATGVRRRRIRPRIRTGSRRRCRPARWPRPFGAGLPDQSGYPDQVGPRLHRGPLQVAVRRVDVLAGTQLVLIYSSDS